MDRFISMQVFCAVADNGSFAAAARKMNMSAPAVTRTIALLEDRLGTRLFVRTTRSVRLTESGERYLLDCRRILLDVEEAEEAAIGSHAAPRGDLHVTAPVLFGRMYIAPILGHFLDAYPLVNAHTMFVDRVVNMMDEGMDIAVRIGNLPDSSLSAVKVGSIRPVVFASSDYLKEHPIPQHPNDLLDHRIILPLTRGGDPNWEFKANGENLVVKVKPRLKMNTNDAVVEMVERGWGISRLLSYQVGPGLKAGRLKTVLGEYEPGPIPVHILHQEGRLVSAKVRACVDFLVEHLRADLDLN